MRIAQNCLRYRKYIMGADMLMLLLAGLMYAWSIFVKPLEAEFGWLRAQTSLTYTISVASNSLAAWMAARIAKKIGPNRVVRLAAVAVMAGFMLASRTKQLWQLYLCYGVMCAGGLGMTYNVILSTIVRWYPEKPGMMSGVMLMCYGLGAMLFGSGVSALVETLGWRAAFMALGAVCFVVMLTGSFLVRNPDEAQQRQLPPPMPQTEGAYAKELSPGTMIRENSFWLFAFWNLTLATIGLNITSHASPIAQSLGLSAGVAALYVGSVSMCNGGSRLLFGAVFDKLGRRRTMLIISMLSVAGSALLWISFSAGSRIGLLLSFMLLGTAFGGAPVSSAIFIKSMYGAKNYGENLGFGNLPVLVAACIGPYLSGVIYEMAGYQLVCIAMTVLGLVGTALGYALYRYKDEHAEQIQNQN